MSFDAVSHWYPARGAPVHALDEVDVRFGRGEFVAIVGPSGCGKTTMLQMLGGFVVPTSGEVRVDEEVVRGPSHERGVVFQRPELYPWLTVRGNVEFGPRMRRVKRSVRRDVASRYLELVGLDGFADHRPYELSGGMQQRCQLARVLANDPAIVLMDEPFGALDALTRERLQGELRTIWRATAKTVVFVTHSVEEAVLLATRVLVLSPRPGRIVYDRTLPFAHSRATLDELRLDPDFLEVQHEVRSSIEE